MYFRHNTEEMLPPTYYLCVLGIIVGTHKLPNLSFDNYTQQIWLHIIDIFKKYCQNYNLTFYFLFYLLEVIIWSKISPLSFPNHSSSFIGFLLLLRCNSLLKKMIEKCSSKSLFCCLSCVFVHSVCTHVWMMAAGSCQHLPG